MIDFIKIKLINTDPEVLLNNPLLDFKQLVTVESGELSNNMVARYRGMKFIIYVSGTTIISGSLHKYMNNGIHNHNDFCRTQLWRVINDFTSTFNLSSRNCTLVNLEVGANVIPTIPTKELLKYLYMHSRKDFKYGDFKNGTYKQVSYSEYYLKAYDKAAQFNLPEQLFRFEIKMTASRIIKKLGVTTLENLKNVWILNRLVIELFNKWQETIIYDPYIEIKVKNDRFYYDKYLKWANPNYWIDLAQNKDIHRNRISKEVKLYREFMLCYPTHLHHQLTKILQEKLQSLLTS